MECQKPAREHSLCEGMIHIQLLSEINILVGHPVCAHMPHVLTISTEPTHVHSMLNFMSIPASFAAILPCMQRC